MKKLIRLMSVSLACAATLLTAACGKKEPAGAAKSDPPASTAGTSAAAGATSADAANGRPVEITGNDTMKFSVTEIRAKAGETLTVTLVNVGTMPKFSMGHNWVLLKSPDVAEPFVNDAMQAATTDYIPQARKGDILAHTKLLGPKERDSVTFKAPATPGKYPFICSFPGHFQVGMRGDLIVE